VLLVPTGVARKLRLVPNMTHILVVDDDPGVRTVVSDALRQDGYQVDAVGNGQQALAAFGKHRPDALVLDLQMPIMDGPTLVRTLRERTKWGAIPLVVVSGAVGAAEAGPQLGARACLTKPFDLSELLRSVERVAPLN
jgi:CheY-like chemotaxis protein